MVADWPHGAQLQPRYRGDDVQAESAFDADRLQGEGIVETADETIGRATDADCHATGRPDISAGQRAWSDMRRGRKDSPTHGNIVREADLGSETLHRTLVILWRSAGRRREDTIESARRKDDIAR